MERSFEPQEKEVFSAQELVTPPSTPPPSLEYTSDDYTIDFDENDLLLSYEQYLETMKMVAFLRSLPAPEPPAIIEYTEDGSLITEKVISSESVPTTEVDCFTPSSP